MAPNPRTIVLIGVVLASLSAAHASADWQYTKWGMTPEQVIEASGGSATWISPPDPPLRSGRQLLVKSPYSAGQLHFSVTFVFALPERHLAQVNMTLKGDDADADLLGQSLVAKYGVPRRGEDDGYPGLLWRDEAGNNLVFVPSGMAMVVYKPLRKLETNGL
jgi:hypothetical protein